jgi:hypothetical protein
MLGLIAHKRILNYVSFTMYITIALYLLIRNITLDKKYITNAMIIETLNQNLYYGILSIIMSIHIIFIQYKNDYYYSREELLIKDLNFLKIKTNDLEKQLSRNHLSIHIKKYYIEKLLEEDFECPICLSKIEREENIFLTLCGHLFHLDCLNEATNVKRKCPSCRTRIYITQFKEEELSDSETEEVM